MAVHIISKIAPRGETTLEEKPPSPLKRDGGPLSARFPVGVGWVITKYIGNDDSSKIGGVIHPRQTSYPMRVR